MQTQRAVELRPGGGKGGPAEPEPGLHKADGQILLKYLVQKRRRFSPQGTAKPKHDESSPS
ncbi:hypothetical protein EYF80_035950 [Liparis tanakae]|uniref:Uncharacterized protein n=1 Tax=Liparis tanakae TaxID=230148 RepID=A0A4Z2GKK1_9TELE|nr:hypothetical protein EYF80_035950 [Liparis tanakae]